MRNSYFFALSLLGAAALGSPAHSATYASQVCPAPQPTTSMVTMLASNFTAATTLDPHWRPFAGQHGSLNAELEAYVPAEAKLVPGAGLRLQTDKQTVWGHPYASAEVTTHGLFAQTYGHFEMMAKMPQANGMWPAFWLLPENNSWPPEIDVVEYIYAPNGQDPSATAQTEPTWFFSNPQTSLHSGANNFTQAQGYNSPIAPSRGYQDWDRKPAPPGWGSAYAGYHIYAIDWRPGSLVYLIDNAPVFCVTDTATTKYVPDMPMYLIMNDAVSAGTKTHPAWAGYVEPTQAFPVAMDIAYVQVSQFKDLVATAPVLPLTITNLNLAVGTATPAAAVTVTPGQTIKLTATVTTGSAALGAENIAVALRAMHMTHYYGESYANIGTAQTTIPALAAHKVYPLSMNYAVPANLAPGTYSLAIAASYASGPVNGENGPRMASLNQAALVTVVAK